MQKGSTPLFLAICDVVLLYNLYAIYTKSKLFLSWVLPYQYREIVQDEFLPEVTSSIKVIVHFYHKDFQRWAARKIMKLFWLADFRFPWP